MPQEKENFEIIQSFTLLGKTYPVAEGKHALIRICELMRERDKKIFDLLPIAIGYGPKQWFRQSPGGEPDGFNRPHHFAGTDMWLDTDLKTVDIIKISKDVVLQFGLKASDLTFSTYTYRKSDRAVEF